MTTNVLTNKEIAVLTHIINTVETELVSSKALGIEVPKDTEEVVKSVKVKLQKATEDVRTSGRQLPASN